MRRVFVLAVAMMTAAAVGVTAESAAAGQGGKARKLASAVTGADILAREQVLQKIADKHDGVRAAGYPGFTAAAHYVERSMADSGFDVKEQHFTFPFYREIAPPSLAMVSPAAATYQADTLDYSGNADLTAPVVPTTGVQVPPAATPGSTSGCSVTDFPPATPAVPEIALIQRGTCSFGDKVLNAQAAGYAGAIIFNEGQPGRTAIISATLGVAVTIPAVSVDYADGAALYAAAKSGGATAHLVTHTQNTPNTDTFNIIADSRCGDPNHVLVIGAYLDALPSGPGINENGSGVSTALEIAKQISKLHLDPKYKIRFVFYGAEQVRARRTANSESIGLLGSKNYVDSLSPAALGKIFATVNLDTLGAANYVRFVDNGNGPTGSALITKVFTDYFASEGLATELHEPPSFDGTTIGPMADAGIPVGGLFGGAAEIKTPAEAAIFGGTAGVSYDACFHQTCDNISNVTAKPLGEFGSAAAYVIWTLATNQGLFVTPAPKQATPQKATAAAAAAGSGWTGAADAG